MSSITYHEQIVAQCIYIYIYILIQIKTTTNEQITTTNE